MDPTCCTPEQMALIGITAEQIALVFFWGFGVVTTFWGVGFVTGIAIRAIKQA